MQLHEKLENLDRYPFHMPGHKRNRKFGITGSEIDITEIAGFDDLHDPEETILDVENRLSKIYGSEKSFLLVNGSTVGILAAILAVTDKGDEIIIGRNCHRSVYNACVLNELKVICAEPEFDENTGCYTVLPQEALDDAVRKHPDAKAVVITSPTYEGMISDVRTDIPLIIDAAHGAHLGLAGFAAYPRADIIISSLHKTLPALTQTAVLNVYDPSLIRRVKRYLGILETSSPSYVLMSSASRCCDIIEHHKDWFDEYYRNLVSFRRIPLRKMRIMPNDDISKVIVSTENTEMRGPELAEVLRNRYSIEAEMSALNHVVLLTSVGDEKEAFDRLYEALIEIDGSLSFQEANTIARPPLFQDGDIIRFIDDCEETERKDAVGKISAEFVCSSPPGIPVLVPGSLITEEVLDYLLRLHDASVHIVSDSSGFPDRILTQGNHG